MASDRCQYEEISQPFDPDKSTVRQLKAILRKNGVQVTGTRAALIKRVKGLTLISGNKRNSGADDQHSVVNRTVSRFVTPLGENLPDPESLNDWDLNLDKLPIFTEKELYNYLVLIKERTCDGSSNNASRQLRAKVFYEDGHVHSLMYHGIRDPISHCYVKGKVIPSIPGQKKDYDVWICLSKVTGHVHSALCNCSAGEGESCNHIAGMLYGMVDFSQKREAGLHSSTSNKCQWIQPRKRKLSPKKAQELHFKKHKFETNEGKRRELFKLNKNVDSVSSVNIEIFAQKLKKVNPSACWLYTVPGFQSSEEKNCSFLKVPFMYNDIIDLNDPQINHEMMKSFKELCDFVDDDFRSNVEKQTRGQSKNWKSAKLGVLGSSNFGLIAKRNECTDVTSHLKTILNYREVNCKSVQWGKSHEKAAKRVYIKMRREEHKELVLQDNGLFLHKDYPYLGSSPDGLIECSCHVCGGSKGTLEIKCPFKYRFLTPQEAAEKSDFYCNLVNGKISLKKSSNYYYQVQGQMALTSRQYCDFFIWTLSGSSVERIYFDKAFWDSTLIKLTEFYKHNVVPELYSNRVKRGKSLFNIEE